MVHTYEKNMDENAVMVLKVIIISIAFMNTDINFVQATVRIHYGYLTIHLITTLVQANVENRSLLIYQN